MEAGLKKVLCQLFNITPRSYSNWSKENRPIIEFFESNYLKKTDIEEFLQTKKISKLELIKNFELDELTRIIKEHEIKRINELNSSVKDLQENSIAQALHNSSNTAMLKKYFENQHELYENTKDVLSSVNKIVVENQSAISEIKNIQQNIIDIQNELKELKSKSK